MDSNVDMSDKNAWDDSLLIDSWDDAVAEYKKYHSIHKSGKRLEDILTGDELNELREDYDDVMEEPEIIPKSESTDDNTDQSVDDMSNVESNGVMHDNDAKTEPQDLTNSEQQQEMKAKEAETSTSHEIPLTMSMPQAVLGSAQDENFKNIMMSWYYAGYYTGLHAGQQQQFKDASPKQ